MSDQLPANIAIHVVENGFLVNFQVPADRKQPAEFIQHIATDLDSLFEVIRAFYANHYEN